MTTPTRTPVGPVRSHIHELRLAGASCKRIAAAAKVKAGVVAGIVYGDGTYIRRESDTESVKRILALTPADIPPAPGIQLRHPAPAAQRRAQALHALGFPWSVIAQHVGCKRETITALVRDGRAQHRTAAAIHTAYDTLRHRTPADEDVTQHVEQQTRHNADANNWHTPDWWDTHGGIDTGMPLRVGTAKRALPEQPAKGWEKHSACHNTDPELFYPASYTTGPGRMQVANAKAICGRCPVRALCLAAALRREQTDGGGDGIWGGTTPTERHRDALEVAA